MDNTVGLHVVSGLVGVGAGFLALYTTKGALVHRKSGIAFVVAMLVMASLGMWISVARNKAPSINIPAGLMTCYLIITSLVTVRRPASWPRGVEIALMGVIVGVGLYDLGLAASEVVRAGRFVAIPTVPFTIFALVCFLAARGDYRVLKDGPLKGGRRLARHLWRMSVAMLVGLISFVVQLPKILPEGVRVPPVMIALPILSIFAIMFYYLWKHRRRSAGVSALPEIGSTTV
jgi:hypothetical protein